MSAKAPDAPQVHSLSRYLVVEGRTMTIADAILECPDYETRSRMTIHVWADDMTIRHTRAAFADYTRRHRIG